MAETVAAPAPAPAAADKKKADKIEKPEKPNTDLFNEKLAKAEKEYQDAFAKYVCSFLILPSLYFSKKEQHWASPCLDEKL